MRHVVKLLLTTLILAACVQAQSVEKTEYVLGPPIYNTDRHTGLYYEARGNLYPKETNFNCQDDGLLVRVGTYRIGVTFGGASEHIAVYAVTLSDRRQLIWNAYIKFDPKDDGEEVSWAYEGAILHKANSQILTDFTPLSKFCFGGKLVVYFLNNGE